MLKLLKMSLKKNVFSCILSFSALYFANAQMKVVNSFPIPGNGRYDYLVTAPDNRLYVSHGNKVDVINSENGTLIDSITGLGNAHGIALDYKNRKGFISDGNNNKLVVFDMDSYKKLNEITTGKNPDAILFEIATKKIIVGNGKSNSISIIDPTSNKVLQTIDIGGKPEAIVSDNKEFLFVNIEDKNAIAVISLNDFSLKEMIDISKEGEEPAGLSIDIKDQLLFAGCRNKKLVIVHYPDKKIVHSYPIGGICDGVVFNQFNQTIYTSNGDGTLNILQRKPDGDWENQSIHTQQNAKTMAIDKKSNTIYLSVAETATEKDASGKPAIIPNTFKVLVIK
ncbi:MAG: hypothetical protein DI598_12080 [Pseudopedobacter saltans]|uniref:Uncharacterized protein n=1 Tax=Pseudopedobacter saltans TaxID=151895 RepID=A0A2W5EWV3_9SPHI|nr:MAG: hypothetical protein DI598_12080 [Pseudopedobacter saltans]